MIDNKYQRGFTSERLTLIREPKVKKDDRGFYLMSLSEDTKVYFDDFYSFLESTYQRACADNDAIEKRLTTIDASSFETIA